MADLNSVWLIIQQGELKYINAQIGPDLLFQWIGKLMRYWQTLFCGIQYLKIPFVFNVVVVIYHDVELI